MATPPKKPTPRQTSTDVSKLASDVLAGRKNATQADARRLAASALSQDQTKGSKKKT